MFMKKYIMLLAILLVLGSEYVQAGGAASGAAAAVIIMSSSSASSAAASQKAEADRQANLASQPSGNFVPINYSITHGCALYHDAYTPVNAYRCNYPNGTVDSFYVDSNGEPLTVVRNIPNHNNHLYSFIFSGVFLFFFISLFCIVMFGLVNFI